MLHLLEQRELGASVDITVVACSKGAEVYSILWKIRSARPDLKVRMRAVDISQDVVTFGEGGVYALNGAEASRMSGHGPAAHADDMTWKDQVWGNQALSMFERMTDDEDQVMASRGSHVAAWRCHGQGIRCNFGTPGCRGGEPVPVPHETSCRRSLSSQHGAARQTWWIHLCFRGGFGRPDEGSN
jgi:hypothetical protein